MRRWEPNDIASYDGAVWARRDDGGWQRLWPVPVSYLRLTDAAMTARGAVLLVRAGLPSGGDAAAALTELVRLKDGPRDAQYEAAKPAAWQAARRAVATSRSDTDDPHSTEAREQVRPDLSGCRLDLDGAQPWFETGPVEQQPCSGGLLPIPSMQLIGPGAGVDVSPTDLLAAVMAETAAAAKGSADGDS